MNRDALETLKALEEMALKRCMGVMKNGACILSKPCTGSCQLAQEAGQAPGRCCRPLTDEERERFAQEAAEEKADAEERRHRLAHPEDYA